MTKIYQYPNHVFFVETKNEFTSVLKYLLDINEITEYEYEQCIPPDDLNRYVKANYKSITIVKGHILFSREKTRCRYDYDNLDVVDMIEFFKLINIPAERPHRELMLQWINDPTMQIEVSLNGTDWEIVDAPIWQATLQYRKYIVKSELELEAERILQNSELMAIIKKSM